MKYTVIAETLTSLSIPVEADSPEAAIEKAMTEGIHGLCAQCAGWGRDWSREEGDEWQEVEVIDSSDKIVWRGLDISTDHTLRHLRSLETLFRDKGMNDAAFSVVGYIQNLESTG